ncbi:MAG: RsiG family protein [Thermoleophilia bacterium]
MENLPELSSLSDKELKSLIRELVTQEQEFSYQRRILHGKIDILRAELVQRLSGKRDSGESLISADDVGKLTEILAKGERFSIGGNPSEKK